MKDFNLKKRFCMAAKHLFTNCKRYFLSVFLYRLRYHILRILYVSPRLARLLSRSIGNASKYHDPVFWDSELRGPKAFYLGEGLPLKARRAMIATLISHTVPTSQSLLDVGCGAGGLALALVGLRIHEYIGVDISQYAIRKAKKNVTEDNNMRYVKFYVSSLSDFTPENNSRFDVIVFSEVLYYLNVERTMAQLERFQNWLQPNGVFCISMLDYPKSRAIYRAILKRFDHVNSITFQAHRSCHGVKYRTVINQEIPVFVTAVFKPQ